MHFSPTCQPRSGSEHRAGKTLGFLGTQRWMCLRVPWPTQRAGENTKPKAAGSTFMEWKQKINGTHSGKLRKCCLQSWWSRPQSQITVWGEWNYSVLIKKKTLKLQNKVSHTRPQPNKTPEMVTFSCGLCFHRLPFPGYLKFTRKLEKAAAFRECLTLKVTFEFRLCNCTCAAPQMWWNSIKSSQPGIPCSVV